MIRTSHKASAGLNYAATRDLHIRCSVFQLDPPSELLKELAVGQPAAHLILAPEHDRIGVVPRRSRFSAKFKRASGNHCAPGILSPLISIVWPISPITPAKPHSVRQKSCGRSMDYLYSAG
jgi:hypothetical protein